MNPLNEEVNLAHGAIFRQSVKSKFKSLANRFWLLAFSPC
jgi:hypothetical protein